MILFLIDWYPCLVAFIFCCCFIGARLLAVPWEMVMWAMIDGALASPGRATLLSLGMFWKTVDGNAKSILNPANFLVVIRIGCGMVIATGLARPEARVLAY